MGVDVDPATGGDVGMAESTGGRPYSAPEVLSLGLADASPSWSGSVTSPVRFAGSGFAFGVP
jgi:hypothetical protein